MKQILRLLYTDRWQWPKKGPKYPIFHGKLFRKSTLYLSFLHYMSRTILRKIIYRFVRDGTICMITWKSYKRLGLLRSSVKSCSKASYDLPKAHLFIGIFHYWILSAKLDHFRTDSSAMAWVSYLTVLCQIFIWFSKFSHRHTLKPWNIWCAILQPGFFTFKKVKRVSNDFSVKKLHLRWM